MVNLLTLAVIKGNVFDGTGTGMCVDGKVFIGQKSLCQQVFVAAPPVVMTRLQFNSGSVRAVQ